MKTPYEVDQALRAANAAQEADTARIAEQVAKRKREEGVIEALIAGHQDAYKSRLANMRRVLRDRSSSQHDCIVAGDEFLDYAEETGLAYIMQGEATAGKALIAESRALLEFHRRLRMENFADG